MTALKTSLFAGLLALGLTLPATAQENRIKPAQTEPARLKPADNSVDIPASALAQLDQFFRTLQSNNSKLAFLNLFDKTQFKEDNEVIENFITASQGSIDRFGKYDRFTAWESNKVGSRLFRVSYISEQGSKLFRWQFLYFTPVGNDWRLANIRVDDLREYLPAQPKISSLPKDVQLKVEKFFVSIQSNRTADAFKDILTGSAIDNSGPNVDAFTQRVEKAVKDYGAMRNYELFDVRPLTAKVTMLTYLGHLETEPLRWQFFFETLPGTPWKLINLRVDDSLDEGILAD
jgi:hypothetical protein